MKKIYCALQLAFCLTSFAYAEDASGTEASLPAPEKEAMRIDELRARLADLDGKVIKTTITGVSGVEQLADGRYLASCGYYKQNTTDRHGNWVLAPKEGKGFFEDQGKKGISTEASQTVYLRVHSASPIKVNSVLRHECSCSFEAIGVRYNKSNGEYSW